MQNNGGQGDPFGTASHFLGHAGTGSRVAFIRRYFLRVVMLGHVGIIVPRRIMEGKATPSGPPRTFSVMLGWVAELPGVAQAFIRNYFL